MAHHSLKTDPYPFLAVWQGRKKFEIRLNDRGFLTGDTLTLRETVYSGEEMEAGKPLEYSGRGINCIVCHIMSGSIIRATYGLKGGWVIMSIDAFDFWEPHQASEPTQSIC